MENEENFLTLCEDAKIGKICSAFHDSAKSNFLASNMEKNELKNARCPLNRGTRELGKIDFQALKMKKIC